MNSIDINDQEFEQICKLVYKKTGISLGQNKRSLVSARLTNRIKSLGLHSFSEYLKRFENPQSEEFQVLIDSITTNETFFFRHPVQFNFFFERGLKELVAQKPNGPLKIWSAASSTGEEAYSIAIMLMEYLKKFNKSYPFEIYASDINEQVLAFAQKGVYDKRSLKELPESLIQKHFDCIEKNGISSFAIRDHVKKHVKFFKHNLNEPFVHKNLDLIFLRNVIIYFDKDIKQKVVNLAEQSLAKHGYFVISLSESLNDIDCSLEFMDSSIYKKASK